MILEQILSHPWNFLIVCCGCALLLYVVLKYSQYPFRFLVDLVTTLAREFFPTDEEKSRAATINAVLVCIFFAICVMALILQATPPALQQALGISAENDFPWIFLLTFIVLVITSIASPSWILWSKDEQKAVKKVRQLLSRR